MKGYRTYILALLLFLYAGTGWLLGKIDSVAAIDLIFSSGLVTTIRLAIANALLELKKHIQENN